MDNPLASMFESFSEKIKQLKDKNVSSYSTYMLGASQLKNETPKSPEEVFELVKLHEQKASEIFDKGLKDQIVIFAKQYGLQLVSDSENAQA